jgi:NADH-quinone oxidoreductase subunit L
MIPLAAEGLYSSAWLLIALPAGVAALLLILGRITNRFGQWLATLAPIASAGLAIALFVDLLGRAPDARAVGVPLYTWISSGSWQIDIGLLIDPLSIVFTLLITIVGSIIHIYSLGYMAHDPNRRRFFAYLNLFIAAMLILVLADDYLVLFIGWEGVGLASYLLISFWQDRPAAAAAGQKAFVMNRVGDLGLLVAIFAMLGLFGSTAYARVGADAGQLSVPWATLIGFMLLLAACGKSAQVPLQAWLLDAMEGPTPVSALIHAATMVTAGVYLVVRSGAIFEQAPAAQLAVAIVGTVTLLVGAWIGCSKDDIKKVLAGSTMSQIGYMMLAAGIGPAGYAFAIFHLLTHGFFKANMFLGAGSVMHATGDDVNMRHYGKLAKALPITFVTFGIGYLAIIGFPFFSGFYSKDHIIEAAWASQPVLGVLALIGAGVTAFYMTRLMIMTYFSAPRWREGIHPHESPAVMWVSLVLLAVGSLGAGMVLNGWIGSWLEPVGAAGFTGSWVPHITVIGVITLVVVALGVLVAWLVFARRPVPDQAPDQVSVLTVIGRHDLFGDAVNDTLVVRPVGALARGVALADQHGIDPATEGTGWLVKSAGNLVRRAQNGYVRTYGVTMAIGVVLIGLLLLVSRLV